MLFATYNVGLHVVFVCCVHVTDCQMSLFMKIGLHVYSWRCTFEFQSVLTNYTMLWVNIFCTSLPTSSWLLNFILTSPSHRQVNNISSTLHVCMLWNYEDNITMCGNVRTRMRLHYIFKQLQAHRSLCTSKSNISHFRAVLYNGVTPTFLTVVAPLKLHQSFMYTLGDPFTLQNHKQPSVPQVHCVFHLIVHVHNFINISSSFLDWKQCMKTWIHIGHYLIYITWLNVQFLSVWRLTSNIVLT